jgi:hypothetical protein
MSQQDRWSLGLKAFCNADQVSNHVLHGISLSRIRFIGSAIASDVDGAGGKTRFGHRPNLMSPGIPALWEAVDHDHQGTLALDGRAKFDRAQIEHTEFWHLPPPKGRL